MDALCRGLHRPALEDNVALVDHLIELQTSAQGLPDNTEDLQKWIFDILHHDVDSRNRMKGIKGEWKRRVDQRLRDVRESSLEGAAPS
jgi:hypothetical protein